MCIRDRAKGVGVDQHLYSADHRGDDHHVNGNADLGWRPVTQRRNGQVGQRQYQRCLLYTSPQIVLVKHLARAGYSRDRFEMLLVTADEAWHISRPLVDFGMRQPVGVGDVTSGLLLVKLLQGATLQEALEHVTAAVYEIMVTTKAMQEYELQVVAAQDRIAKPEHYFSATKL